jgi:hypothetical protein
VRLNGVTRRFTIEQRRDFWGMPAEKQVEALSHVLHDLTPMGSEYVNPLNAIEYIADTLDKVYDLRKEVVEARRNNQGAKK